MLWFRSPKSYADQEPERLAALESSAELLARAFSDAVQLAPACVPEGGLITLSACRPALHGAGGGETADMEAEAEDDALERLLPEKVEEIARRAGAYASICVLTRTTGQSEKAASWLLARGIPVLTQSQPAAGGTAGCRPDGGPDGLSCRAGG